MSNCRHKDTVDTNKLGKYGVCAKCNGFEHFNCVNVSDWIKDNVNDGCINYYCKNCLSANPELGFQKSLDNTSKQVESTEATKQIENVQILSIQDIPDKLECNQCDFDTQFEETLKDHREARHKEPESEKHDCKECSFKSKTSEILRKHIEDTHSKDELYECNSCDFKSKDKEAIPIHIKENHSTNNVFKCSKCDFETREKVELSNHERISYKNICEICVFEAEDEPNLKKHIDESHSSPASFPCEFCPHNCTSKNDLDKHKEEQHTNLSQCDYKCKDEKSKIERDYKLLQENYDRLIELNKDLQTEAMDKNYAIEVQPVELKVEYEKVKSENLKLKEQNDIQSKLGKVWVEKTKLKMQRLLINHLKRKPLRKNQLLMMMKSSL